MWCEEMSDPVIRVENLGKRYRLGQIEPYRTLRDVIMKAVRGPFKVPSASPSTNPSHTPSPGNDGYLWALRNVSFEVQEGEVVGIIGPNGAGKTTLLKVLTRITEPTEGRAEIRGRVGSLLEVGTGFHPELTGRENIYLNGAILGMKKSEIESKFEKIVDFAELEEFIETPVKRYSSGMYVRLAFAVAAYLEPEVMLVDEVLAVGDYNFQRKCIDRIQQLADENTAILFVSHNMSTVNLVAERAVYLHQGRIRKKGTASEVVATYLDDQNRLRTAGVITTDESKSQDSPESHTPCRILGVEVLNAGEVSQVFEENDTLNIRIHYEASTRINNPYFGLTLWTDDGIRISTLDSRFSLQPNIGVLKGKGVVECTISQLSLLPGTYLLRARIFDSKTGWPYDSLGWEDGKVIPFYVKSIRDREIQFNRYHGIIQIPTEWNRIS